VTLDLASTPEGAAGDLDDAVGVKLASLRRAASLLFDVVGGSLARGATVKSKMQSSANRERRA
jgi:hypothetical protein